MKAFLKLFGSSLFSAFLLGTGLSPKVATAADPTFSDANWNSMGVFPGVNNTVKAVVVDGENLYVGGDFSIAGNVFANHIAKWNGSGWSTLG